jgi:hypothetical protein
MDSSPGKTKRSISGTSLAAFGFTSRKPHIDTAGNIQPSASTPVSDSSTHLVASLPSSSSPSLLGDDITAPLAPSYVPSVPIQTQMEMITTVSLSSREVSAETSSINRFRTISARRSTNLLHSLSCESTQRIVKIIVFNSSGIKTAHG